MNYGKTIVMAAGALALAACSSNTEAEVEATTSATPSETVTPTPTPSTSLTPVAMGPRTLTLEGLGDLVIGSPVPAGSSFQMRGAQASDTCLIYNSPDFSGVYAMVEGGALRRITVSGSSDVRLREGVGVGSTEQEVLAAFPGFASTPHEYVAAPGKYLTQPGGDPRLRFEIGESGKVTAVHVGMSPQLQYVEGCA